MGSFSYFTMSSSDEIDNMMLLVCMMIQDDDNTSEPVKRSLWQQDWLKNRELDHAGNYNTILEQARTDRHTFKKAMRMDYPTFQTIVNNIDVIIGKMDTNYRKSIPVGMRLAITLNLLSTGSSLVSLSTYFRVGLSTVSQIVTETCKAICEVYSDKYIKLINKQDEWNAIADGFASRWNLPNCLRALDVKNIVIQAIPRSGSIFFNYKGNLDFYIYIIIFINFMIAKNISLNLGTNSIVLMALIDSSRRFIFVDIGCNGRVSDGGVFNQSSIFRLINDPTNPLYIPPPKPLPGRTTKIPFFIVAYAFQLKENIVKPFPNRGLTISQRIYNYRQSRARMNVENAFGMLASRFTIFKNPCPSFLKKYIYLR